ncbi:MAG: LysR family transcriptional regulator [Myxococcales bacterium]|nr:LysR family transcriptional regulator [Myxococcales bacterium]
MRLFLAATHAGSLSAAAAELGIGQATMSRRIAQLEERVGHVLFDRHRSGLVLTEAGQALRPHAEGMAASARRAIASLEGVDAEPEGVVRVAVPPGLAVDLLPPLLPALRRRHPRIRLEVLSDNFARDLSRREADIAIRSSRPTSGELLYRRLPAVRLGIFASADYVARLPEPVALTDLDWVQYSPELLHIPFARWVEEWRGDKPCAFTSNSFLAMRSAAACGLGAMVLPALQGHLAGLVPIDGLPVELPDVPWFMVTLRALRRVPRVAAVVAFVAEAMEHADDTRTWPPAALA